MASFAGHGKVGSLIQYLSIGHILIRKIIHIGIVMINHIIIGIRDICPEAITHFINRYHGCDRLSGIADPAAVVADPVGNAYRSDAE